MSVGIDFEPHLCGPECHEAVSEKAVPDQSAQMFSRTTHTLALWPFQNGKMITRLVIFVCVFVCVFEKLDTEIGR